MDLLPFFLEKDEDLILFHLINQPRVKERKYHKVVKSTEEFNLGKLTNDYCWLHFRFYKADLVRLREGLGVPEWLKCRKVVAISGIEALCIVLMRLSYPNRYYDLMKYFPRTRCELSRIFNCTVLFIIRESGHRLTDLNQKWLTMYRLEKLSEALVKKGSPYKECFGFVDGTVRPICRPTKNQKEYYNGHKRVHALKFQSVLVANGLVVHLSGPVVGRRHDGFLLESSRLILQLEKLTTQQGRPYHLYGDPAYPLIPNLITPFRAHTLTPSRRACNKQMSSIRESVEWGFNKVIQLFAFLDYKKNLKFGKQPIGEYYNVGMLLGNCHTCIYGSQTSIYFDCVPPTLEEYLA